jgi:hypothetical protein
MRSPEVSAWMIIWLAGNNSSTDGADLQGCYGHFVKAAKQKSATDVTQRKLTGGGAQPRKSKFTRAGQ